MKLLIAILLLTSICAKGQLIADTIYYENGAKIISYRNATTTTITTPTRLRDSMAIVKTVLDSMRTNIYTAINGKQPSGSYLVAADIAGKQNTITVLPFANGGISGAAAASATSGTISLPMTSRIITVTPTGAITFNATGGIAGQMVTIYVTTSGTTSYTITFGTNFRKTGTLATGVASARYFAVSFLCIDGTIWAEIGRTAAQT
jgi:hypothetical protein